MNKTPNDEIGAAIHCEKHFRTNRTANVSLRLYNALLRYVYMLTTLAAVSVPAGTVYPEIGRRPMREAQCDSGLETATGEHCRTPCSAVQSTQTLAGGCWPPWGWQETATGGLEGSIAAHACHAVLFNETWILRQVKFSHSHTWSASIIPNIY